jgi:ABC-type glutathione transport system ATPase component
MIWRSLMLSVSRALLAVALTILLSLPACVARFCCRQQADETQGGRATIEPVSEALRRQLTADSSGTTCIALRKLTKAFPARGGAEPVHAVNELDLTMYRGQITALLGHVSES